MKIILHEGKDDKKYIKRICEYLELEVTDKNFYEMGDKSTFFKEKNKVYDLIQKNPKISQILFVLDADYQANDSKYGGYENSEREIKLVMKNLKLLDKSDYCISCNPKTKDGYFETLFFSCVPDDLKKCYEEFMKCSGFKEKENYKTIMTKLHEMASPSKPYDFEHQNFIELKQKLKNLFKEEN
jgi:hypothetical protein